MSMVGSERLTLTNEEMDEIRQYAPDFDCPVKAHEGGVTNLFCESVCDEFKNNCPFMEMGKKLKCYEDVGTIEEFKALKEDKNFLEFLYNQIPPNEMEQYLSIYHTKDKVAVNGYAEQCGLMPAT